MPFQGTINRAIPVVVRSSVVVIYASVGLITQSVPSISDRMKESNIGVVEKVAIIGAILLFYSFFIGFFIYYCWCKPKDWNKKNKTSERPAYRRISESVCEMEMSMMPTSKSAEESTCEAEISPA